jgi:hypothetical protein
MSAFKQGDPVCNTNERSIHYGVSGLFQRVHNKWTFPTGLACDVLVKGGYGPYGCEDVIMSVADLEPVAKSEAS